ncbi:MAG: type II secretion system F family protein [Coriobacteriales bacterium]|jgi:tight adherence protein B|nr:type II secretion system F family protein [Coriobacteriales bacterium]
MVSKDWIVDVIRWAGVAKSELVPSELASSELAPSELAPSELAQRVLAQNELTLGELAQNELTLGELARGETFEPTSLALAAAILLGALAASLAVPLIYETGRSFVNRSRTRMRLTNTISDARRLDANRNLKSLLLMLFEDLCRNGIASLRFLSNRLMRSAPLAKWCARVSSALSARVPFIKPQNLCELELAASLVLALMVFILTGQFILALAAAVIPPFVSIQRATAWHRLRQIRLREQLPDALNAIGMCFSAGYSLQQALAQIADELPDPLGTQLRLTVDDIDVGYSISEALERLEERTDCADLRFVLVALDIQHTTGGSLRKILEGATASITDSFELARSLEVQTAQARMSARVVTIMPLALFVLLSLAMPGYLATFFGSFGGFMLLVVALGLEVLGIVIIRRILGIDLE